jgi:hypothetical protein
MLSVTKSHKTGKWPTNHLQGTSSRRSISTRQFARWEARERGGWQNRKRDYKHEHGSSTAAPVAVD